MALIVIIPRLGSAFAGQVADHSAHKNIPITADGSKNPEKIPDQVAYRHFVLQAGSHRNNPSTQEMDRRSALLVRLKLSQSDQTALVSALDGVPEQLDTVNWSGTGSAATAAARDAIYEQFLDTALLRLRASLSADGLSKVDKFVQTHVKAHIVMFGTAQ